MSPETSSPRGVGEVSKSRFSIHDLYKYIFMVWREKRFKRFLTALKPSPSDSLLDVGGVPDFWTSRPRIVGKIEVLNIYPIEMKPRFHEYDLETIVGDGRELPFSDQSYDIVFSNSVIEHVGDWNQQKAFASELLRVGKRLWLQTPAFSCPVEPHYLGLFIHWLPRRMQRAFIPWVTVWGWSKAHTLAEIDEMIDDIRLLRSREIKELFPHCEIITERFLVVFPKSYIVIKR